MVERRQVRKRTREELESMLDAEVESGHKAHGLLADICDAAFGDPERAATHGYEGVLERVKELVERSRWRSMDSVPRDGTRVLVVRKDRVAVARWNSQQYHKRPRPYWEDDRSWRGVFSDRAEEPTAWQPLPSPPTPGEVVT